MKNPIPTKYNKNGTQLTKPYLELSEEQQTILIDFIQCHYYASESMFSPVSKKLLNALLAGSEFSHVSLSYQEEMKVGLNDDTSSSYITKWIKEQYKSYKKYWPLEDRTLVMIFEKASTRTRPSFEAGMSQLGGTGIYLNTRDSQIGRGEPVADAAQVISRMCAAVMIRTFEQDIIDRFAKN